MAHRAGGTVDPAGDAVMVRAVDPAEEPGKWRERARCAETDPEAFFLDAGTPWAAKRICARCDVRAECLDYALAHDERFGVWGGLSESERRRLPRRIG